MDGPWWRAGPQSPPLPPAAPAQAPGRHRASILPAAAHGPFMPPESGPALLTAGTHCAKVAHRLLSHMPAAPARPEGCSEPDPGPGLAVHRRVTMGRTHGALSPGVLSGKRRGHLPALQLPCLQLSQRTRRTGKGGNLLRPAPHGEHRTCCRKEGPQEAAQPTTRTTSPPGPGPSSPMPPTQRGPQARPAPLPPPPTPMTLDQRLVQSPGSQPLYPWTPLQLNKYPRLPGLQLSRPAPAVPAPAPPQ